MDYVNKRVLINRLGRLLGGDEFIGSQQMRGRNVKRINAADR